ncbi:hypothetical protein [Pseudomonas vanderleydeniana]|uniref:Transposase n=1 Tax=Pseudomonas vanderleydeniana TaxID=2745495 RepID=A0A9E6PGW0_9PSED|nr:hypothetical protein [Pseudomonas vanderleydeniana]QXI25876.1 hypothetical protein HU752_018075 [Pseudomonas vanderleydeniana]
MQLRKVVQECEQRGISVVAIAMRHGINASVVRTVSQAVALPAFIPLKVEPKRKTEALTIIELPLAQQALTVKWPTSDPEGCA